MENIRIIPAAAANKLARHLKIRETVFIAEKGVPPEIELDEHDRPGGVCDHFLIVYGQKDAGAFRCLRTAEKTVRIQRFCLLREYRGLGLGRVAMDYIRAFYITQSAERFELNAKYEARGFYEKCGYRQISEPFMEAGVKRVAMVMNK